MVCDGGSSLVGPSSRPGLVWRQTFLVHFLTFAHVWMWAYNYIKIITDILEAEWSNGKSAQVIVRHTGSEPHSPLHFINWARFELMFSSHHKTSLTIRPRQTTLITLRLVIFIYLYKYFHGLMTTKSSFLQECQCLSLVQWYMTAISDYWTQVRDQALMVSKCLIILLFFSLLCL